MLCVCVCVCVCVCMCVCVILVLHVCTLNMLACEVGLQLGQSPGKDGTIPFFLGGGGGG